VKRVGREEKRIERKKKKKEEEERKRRWISLLTWIVCRLQHCSSKQQEVI
jgi:hypothetical protein